MSCFIILILLGYDIGERIVLAKLFNDPFSYHMIRQAAERLGADDIVDAAFTGNAAGNPDTGFPSYGTDRLSRNAG